MSEAECLAVMKNELQNQMYIYWFCILLACALTIPQLIQRIRKRYQWTQLQQKRFWIGVLLFIVSSYMMFSRTAALRKDINNKQIVSQHGSYYFDTKHAYHRRKPYMHAFVDEDIVLMLPSDWNEKDFPFGRFTGQIYYAKESKLLLGFVPDIEQEDS